MVVVVVDEGGVIGWIKKKKEKGVAGVKEMVRGELFVNGRDGRW